MLFKFNNRIDEVDIDLKWLQLAARGNVCGPPKARSCDCFNLV